MVLKSLDFIIYLNGTDGLYDLSKYPDNCNRVLEMFTLNDAL